MRATTLLPALLIASAVHAPRASAQVAPPQQLVPYPLHSGLHDGRGAQPELVWETVVTVPGVPWMRLEFTRAELGAGSFLHMTAGRDGEYQTLDAEAFEQWGRASALFNGDTVSLQLYAAPLDAGVEAELARVRCGPPRPSAPVVLKSLCGGDDRVPSADNRVGRLFFGGCTAFRVTNGAFVTAGHCVDLDPDDVAGPMQPDGIPDLNGVVEFNVPASGADGTPSQASTNDQYAIDTTSLVWEFDGGTALGDEWGIFRVFPNPNTNLLPHEAYGLPFRASREKPIHDASITVTGFGIDSTPPGSTGAGNPGNFAQQTASGPYDDEFFYDGGADITHEYEVDTTDATSGAPIHWDAFGVVIGINTNSGCEIFAYEDNVGTSFEVDFFEQALASFPGPVVTYADVGFPVPVPGDGSVMRPFATMLQAYQTVPAGGIVSIVAGSYTAAAGHATVYDRAALLSAPVGAAVIGN